MIAFLISIFVLWLCWRWLCRSTSSYVEIAPTAADDRQPPDAVDHYPPASRCQ
jgi:hypothetical protein